MIQAKELRTGNLVEYFLGENNEGENWEPTALDWQDIKWCEEDNEEFNRRHRPIKLTEEKLMRLGFAEGNNTYFTRIFEANHANTDGEFSINIKFSINISLKYGTLQIGLGEPFLIAPQWVHSLQNTVFTLTGEELSYKK